MAAFQIITRGMPSRPDEWFRALDTANAELPKLTEDDKKRARLRRMTDEQYARHLMLRANTRQREMEEAERLGKTIVEILRGLGSEFQLKGIGKRGVEPGWWARIESSPRGSVEKIFDVQFPTEDFSDEQNSEILNIDDTEQIRNYLISRLGLEKSRTVAS